MDYIDLEKKISRQTRFLILCSPHNPTGRVWTREELEKLADICIRKDILIISDEIHFDLVFKGHRHTPLASLSREIAERTITCTAPTKAFNFPGLTTSYVIVSNPENLSRFKKALRQNEGLYLGNIFGIAALEASYRYGGFWLDNLVSYLEDNMDFAAEFIDSRIPEMTFFKPEGTFLALIDCRRLGLKPSRINEFLLKKSGVLLSDGSIFGDELKGFQRINLGCPRSIVQKALERIEKAVHSSSSSSGVF
jgi:cystathionine beta-lyase